MVHVDIIIGIVWDHVEDALEKFSHYGEIKPMIASPCSNCCFFKNGKCEQNQFFISTPKANFAPGFCLTYRSKKWAEQNKDLSLVQLKEKAIEECKLEYDLIILYDLNDLNRLECNLRYNITHKLPGCRQVIICDIVSDETTEQKKEIVLWFNKIRKIEPFNKVSIKLDLLIDSKETREQTIKRINHLIENKYFIVVRYDFSLYKEHYFRDFKITSYKNRFVYWPFFCHVGYDQSNPANTGSFIVPYSSVYGIYIDNAYKQLTRNEKTFNENLREEEAFTGILLSCPINIIV